MPKTKSTTPTTAPTIQVKTAATKRFVHTDAAPAIIVHRGGSPAPVKPAETVPAPSAEADKATPAS